MGARAQKLGGVISVTAIVRRQCRCSILYKSDAHIGICSTGMVMIILNVLNSYV